MNKRPSGASSISWTVQMMLEGRGCPGLLDEPLPGLRIARKLGGEELEGHGPLEARFLGPEDNPHPAPAQLVDDPILSGQEFSG